jgi:hypothetical protein
MDIILRKDAKEAGLLHYFTGKPCKNGHIDKRQVSNGMCQTCGRVKMSTWRSENPERSKEIVRLHRERNPEKVLESSRRYHANNREKRREYSKIYHHKNREVTLQKMREYKQRNKSQMNAYKAKRMAQKLCATPSWYGEFDVFIMQEAYQLCIDRKKATGIEWDVDHMIPLQAKGACGLHCGLNIQVIPSRMNNGKGNRMIMTEPLEWVSRL